jgi:ubiquinone biosynthesis protein COQ4
MMTTTATTGAGAETRVRGARKDWDANKGADGGWMTEADAVRLALEGTAAEKLRAGFGALGRLLVDPDDTVQVFLMGIVLNGPYVPRLMLRIAADPEGAKLIEERPAIDSSTVDWDRLRALPKTTLGGAYVRYLDENKLDPDLFQAPPALPQPLRFIAQRIRQTHDIWHVLTGYAPDVPGELALQGFTFAQLRMPSSLLLSTLGTLFKAPTNARRVLDGYRRGRDAAFLPVVRFETMWERELDDVRRELGVRPPAPARRAAD